MPEQNDTDMSAVVPPAAPLVGESGDPDQLDPADVLPSGGAGETENLVGEEQRRREEQA